MLGDAINRLIKFYHKSLNEKLSYAHLMCGEGGLVHALASIFSFGYKSVRLFGRNLSVWDFFLKVTMDFNQVWDRWKNIGDFFFKAIFCFPVNRRLPRRQRQSHGFPGQAEIRWRQHPREPSHAAEKLQPFQPARLTTENSPGYGGCSGSWGRGRRWHADGNALQSQPI